MTLTHQRCRPNRGGFSPASEIRSSGNQLRSMASLVCRPLAVAINATVAPLAHIQGGHCRPHHRDTTNTSPHPTGRPPSRTPTAEATPAGARHPPPWPSNGHRGQRVHHADRARIRRHQNRKSSSSPHPSTEGHREADPATGGPPPPPPRKPPEGRRQGDCAKPPPRRARRQTRDLPSPPHPDTARPQGRQNQWPASGSDEAMGGSGRRSQRSRRHGHHQRAQGGRRAREAAEPRRRFPCDHTGIRWPLGRRRGRGRRRRRG
jgi:hypothetical protein